MVQMPVPAFSMDGYLQALGKGKVWLNQKSFSKPSGSCFAFFSPLPTRMFSLPTC